MPSYFHMNIQSTIDPQRNAQPIESNQLLQLATSHGYEVIETYQPWRHACAHLKKEGQEYFLKLASTTAIGERTRNEIAWNLAAYDYLLMNNLTVPKVHEHGDSDGLAYYITDYYHGRPLFTGDTNSDSEIAAKVSLSLLSLPPIDLPRDHSKDGPGDQIAYREHTRRWLADLQDYQNLAELFELAWNQVDTYYTPAMQHGDFAPGHLIQTPERVVLIDGEAASSKTCKFYDCAYLFHRLASKTNQPKEAIAFIERFQSKLPSSDLQLFEKLFPALLALRTVGGWRDHVLGDNTNPEAHQRLLMLFGNGIIDFSNLSLNSL
jgi:hypothetical protein